MGMTEYEDEPVEGLPEHLPEGETMVWQGRPTAAAMGKRVFFIRHLTLYFGLLIAGHTVYRLMEGVSAAQVMGTLVWQSGLAATVLVLLTWLARAYAKSILYTLTSERLVIRSGVALPMMANIPIEQITAADMRVYRDGTGDILLKPASGSKAVLGAVVAQRIGLVLASGKASFERTRRSSARGRRLCLSRQSALPGDGRGANRGTRAGAYWR
ncbi:MAG: photosynthetic complex assembly protein [Alteromonadaceae bacterium]|nr:photosynthetic complex assembly protein [Alteromonadaceae bacterium]